MTIKELKQYIYDHKKIELILQKIGCNCIVYHQKNELQKSYWSCTNVNGDNTDAVNIKDVPYLSCKNWTRDKYFDERSDIITFVQYSKSLSDPNFDLRKTIIYLHKLLGLKLLFSNEKEKNKEEIDPLHIFKKVQRKKYNNVTDVNFIEERELWNFIPHIHIDWFREGIIKKTIQKFGLAYSVKRSRNVIPLRYWMNGQLLGFNMRTTIPNYEELGIKKYYLTSNYPKQLNIYGLWENSTSIKKAGYVVVYEAEKSVLKRDSLLDSTGVAIGGHNISEEQSRILIGLNCEIIIAFDKDISIDHVRFTCEKFFHIRKISYIYDKFNLLKSKDSPADANLKTYQTLFDHRVIYDESEHQKYLRSLEGVNNKKN